MRILAHCDLGLKDNLAIDDARSRHAAPHGVSVRGGKLRVARAKPGYAAKVGHIADYAAAEAPELDLFQYARASVDQSLPSSQAMKTKRKRPQAATKAARHSVWDHAALRLDDTLPYENCEGLPVDPAVLIAKSMLVRAIAGINDDPLASGKVGAVSVVHVLHSGWVELGSGLITSS